MSKKSTQIITRIKSNTVFKTLKELNPKYHVPFDVVKKLLRDIHKYGMASFEEGIELGRKKY